MMVERVASVTENSISQASEERDTWGNVLWEGHREGNLKLWMFSMLKVEKLRGK